MKAAGGPGPLHVEGIGEAQWVLIDFGDFVVHVFLDEVRRYYDLERLWADAPRWSWEDARRPIAGGCSESGPRRWNSSSRSPASGRARTARSTSAALVCFMSLRRGPSDSERARSQRRPMRSDPS